MESSLAGVKESSAVKSKIESDEPPCFGFFTGLLTFLVQSAIRPSLSEREKGAKGTSNGRLEDVAVVVSGGPHPSGLNGTAPTSKPPTIAVSDTLSGSDSGLKKLIR